MKQLLMTCLLLAVIVLIYNATIGGGNGTKAMVRTRGQVVGASIQSIDP
ncbi:hypothetical protein [Paenibacillus sp. HJGM_3]